MASWYLAQIRYQKEDEAGSLKTHTELYLIDSISFTEVEAICYKKIVTGASDFSVTKINPMRLADMFPYEDGENWFKAKVVYLSVDEKSGKDKKVVNYMLVNADGIEQAMSRIFESLRTMLIPYELTDLNQTKILDVIPYVAEKSMDEVLEEIAKAVNSHVDQLNSDIDKLKSWYNDVILSGSCSPQNLKYISSFGVPLVNELLNSGFTMEDVFSSPISIEKITLCLTRLVEPDGILFQINKAEAEVAKTGKNLIDLIKTSYTDDEQSGAPEN